MSVHRECRLSPAVPACPKPFTPRTSINLHEWSRDPVPFWGRHILRILGVLESCELHDAVAPCCARQAWPGSFDLSPPSMGCHWLGVVPSPALLRETSPHGRIDHSDVPPKSSQNRANRALISVIRLTYCMMIRVYLDRYCSSHCLLNKLPTDSLIDSYFAIRIQNGLPGCRDDLSD